MCLYPGCPSTPRAPNTHDLACRKSRDEPVCRLRSGELGGGGRCQGVVSSGGIVSRGRGHFPAHGDKLRVRGQDSGPRRRRLSPFGRTRTRPHRNVPERAALERAALSPTASTVLGRANGHPRATVGAESGRTTTRARTVTVRALGLERVTGIEPALSAWEAEVLPLNYTRVAPVDVRPRCVRKSNPDSGRLRKSACGGASGGRAGSALASRLSHGFPDVFIGVMSA